jgi:hypothetical protein
MSLQAASPLPGPLKTGPTPSRPLWPEAMTSEVFNANPTIVATAAPTARRRAAFSLWLSDDEDSDIYDSDDEPQPIDADEIFGLFLFLFCALSAQS